MKYCSSTRLTQYTVITHFMYKKYKLNKTEQLQFLAVIPDIGKWSLCGLETGPA